MSSVNEYPKKEVKISVIAPFEFCEECKIADLRRDGFDFSNKTITWQCCENERICRNAVKLYQKRVEEGRPV